ncbi:hypothetical protein FRC01_008609, partial [Tulasnella sp. 417]
MHNPSAREIERETAALRDIRRRSGQAGPGAIPLDPDLPPNGPGGSASAGGYWDNYTGPPQRRPSARLRPQEDPTPSQDVDDVPDDPSHLFWVPAHLHPEIAPAEFRAFLKEHTAASPDGAMPISRSLSTSSSLGRKKSLLSKQYTPSANDHVEDERPPVSVKRNRSSIYSTAGPQLTISDLQKLEQLAEEAAASDDPSKLRKVLRRSLSLNVAPSFIDAMDDIPSTVDEADEPIIVPRPGQILRRTARTKIRKPGLVGDGGGHRFGPSRRGGRVGGKADTDVASDSGHESASEHRHSLDKSYEQNDRPLSYADEAFILDAYGDRRDSMASASSSLEDDDLASSQSHSTAPTSAPQSKSHESSGQRPISPPTAPAEGPLSPPRGQPTVRRVSPPQPEEPQPQYQPEPPQHPQLHHPSPQRHGHLEVPGQSETRSGPNRSPSPGSASDVGTGRAGAHSSTSPDPFRRSPSAPPQTGGADSSPSAYTPPVPSPAPSIKSTKSEKGREKGKKGLLEGILGGGKEKKKEKDAGFFGSLFGGGKKKQEEPESKGGLLSGAGPAAAAALLGASKSSKNQVRPPSPNLTNNYSRYPIHVERAVYRLSHIKLANPRRPLYEQVLISNLMFWYLGIINKVTPPGPAANNNQVAAGGAGSPTSEGGAGAGEDGEKAERDRQERERAEMEEKERVERERLEREQRERDMREKEQRERAEKEGRKRGTLVKNVTPPGGQPRRAEMPVRGPQYDVQHRIMEQEQGNAGAYGRGPPPMGRGPATGGPPQQRGPQHPPNQGYPQQQPGNYQQFSPSLPPGAMPPPSNGGPEQWLGSATNSRESPYAAAAGGPGRSRSPPQQKSPPPGVGRSTSANANAGGPPPNYGRPSSAGGPTNGGQWGAQQQQRRGPSPQPPPGERRRRNSSGGDDVPLGQWQQQQQQQQYRGGPIPDLKKLEAGETSSAAALGNVIDGIESLELSTRPDPTVEAAPRPLFDLLPDELVVAILTAFVTSYIEPSNQHKAPSRVLRVSKRIHAIAIGTPHLWKTIVVDADLDLLRLGPYLPRATAIHIYIYGRFERETNLLLDQIRILSIRGYDWKSLNIRASNHRIARVLLSQVPPYTPNLQSLIIRSNRPASITTFFVCPKLETLIIKEAHLDWRKTVITSLRHLEVVFRQLNDAVWSSFETFLRSNAAQLQHLSIRFGETVQGRPTNSPIRLGSLDTLRIADMSGEIVLPLLSSLELPRLRVLQLSGDGSGWPSWNPEEKEFKLVEEFNLHDLLCGEEVLVSLVKGLPGLRRVSLRTEGVRPSQ